jgi:hypothetical protein
VAKEKNLYCNFDHFLVYDLCFFFVCIPRVSNTSIVRIHKITILKTALVGRHKQSLPGGNRHTFRDSS